MSRSSRWFLVLCLAATAVACSGNNGGTVIDSGTGNGGDGRGGDGSNNTGLDGRVTGGDGSTTTGDGATIGPDGEKILPDGGTTMGSDGSTTGSDGSTSGSDSSTGGRDGTSTCGASEICNDGLDNNCNGTIDEMCPCLPGTTQRCYDGDPALAGRGVCVFGTQTCTGAGEFGLFGPCMGAGRPQPVMCGSGMDSRCNGVIDEGCGCTPGLTRTCYTGPTGTDGVGLCRGGMAVCSTIAGGGAAWGPCTGEVTPTLDVCDGMDHDCDGRANTGCTCVVGTSRSCYTGPAGTAGVGLCRAGTQRCVAGAGGTGSTWDTCSGQITPVPNTCDGVDRMCNGLPMTGCPCTIGMTRSCYTGPAGTSGVGICRNGTNTCVAMGSTAGFSATCSGQATPAAAEVCGNMLDDNCNGTVDEGCGGMIMCPGDQAVDAGDPISLTVTGAGLRNYVWTIVSGPTGGPGTATWAPSPPTAATESFTPFIVGLYTIRVSAIDSTGRTVTCMFNVTARPHGLRVQASWNGSGDVDLHLHNGTTTPWFASPNDCYYGNRTPAWGASLDFDNTTANGPENTVVNTPAIGMAYTIGVHNYSGSAGRTVTIQVFCGTTGGTTPTQTFTSRALAGTTSGNCSTNDFWRVARVVFTSPTTCTITPINTYTASSNACTTF